jgi:hypothetical protein
MSSLEIAYTCILVLVFLLVVWFTLFVVFKLFKGQD